MIEEMAYYEKNKFGRPKAISYDLARVLVKVFGWKFSTPKSEIASYRISKESKINLIK